MLVDNLLSLDEVNELLETAHVAFEDRRVSQRRPFPIMQRVAPYDGIKLTDGNAFVDVRCEDLSQGGISFQWRTRPQYKHVVVELKMADRCIYFAAKVIHATPIDERTFRVGCQFIARVGAVDDPS